MRFAYRGLASLLRRALGVHSLISSPLSVSVCPLVVSPTEA